MKNLMRTLYFIFIVGGIIMVGLGSAMPYIEKNYNMSYSFVGIVQSFIQLGSLFPVLLMGAITAKMGRKNAFIMFLAVAATGFVLVTLTKNHLFLLIAFTLVGTAKSSITTLPNGIINSVSENPMKSLNFMHSIFSFGSLTSPFILILILKFFDWKAFFILIAILCAMGMLLIKRCDVPDAEKAVNKKTDFSFFKLRSFWISSFIFFFYIASELMVMSWMVFYFQDNNILSESLAQISLSLLCLMIMLGRIFIAAVSSKIKNTLLLVILSAGALIFFGVLVLADTPLMIFIGIAGSGLFFSGVYPTTISALDEKVGKSDTAMGISLAIGTLGSIFMPVIVGKVADNFGITWGMITISSTLIFLLIFTVLQHLHREKSLKLNK